MSSLTNQTQSLNQTESLDIKVESVSQTISLDLTGQATKQTDDQANDPEVKEEVLTKEQKTDKQIGRLAEWMSKAMPRLEIQDYQEKEAEKDRNYAKWRKAEDARIEKINQKRIEKGQKPKVVKKEKRREIETYMQQIS